MRVILLSVALVLDITALVIWMVGGMRRTTDKGLTKNGKIGLVLFIIGGVCAVTASYLSMLHK